MDGRNTFDVKESDIKAAVMKLYDENNELISTVYFLKSYIYDNPYSDVDKTKPLHFGNVQQSWGNYLSKFTIKEVEIKTPIR